MRGDCVYNRYIPGTDGTFQRMTVVPPEPPLPPPPPDAPCDLLPPQPAAPCAGKGGHPLRGLLPKGLDTGDLLILVILLLLLIDGDEDDTLSVLLTFAAFILM